MPIVQKPNSTYLVRGIIIGSILLVVILAIIFIPILARSHVQADNSTPPFDSVSPQNTSIQDLGGWQKLTPPNGESLYIFTDSIDGISINVSQQPLPDKFKKNVDGQVAELAKNYNAGEVLDANGTKVYIGLSAKGPQSVIFTKKDLLILIKSQKEIQDSSWISYVNSLQ